MIKSHCNTPRNRPDEEKSGQKSFQVLSAIVRSAFTVGCGHVLAHHRAAGIAELTLPLACASRFRWRAGIGRPDGDALFRPAIRRPALGLAGTARQTCGADLLVARIVNDQLAHLIAELLPVFDEVTGLGVAQHFLTVFLKNR